LREQDPLMPLPEGGPWPPDNLAPVFQRLQAWSAWYSGNPDELSMVYGAQAGVPYDNVSLSRMQNHPSQYRGGVVGWFARWFWGEPTNLQQKRTKLHVPIAADIARTSAELLFSEPPTIKVPEDEQDTTTQDRIDTLIDDGAHATLLEGAELCAALGGVYLTTCWDREIADKPWPDARHADAAVPEWQWGRLSAVTFWRVLADDGRKVVRHLERHEKGAIVHAVYEGTPEQLGKPIDLGAFAETKDLDPIVETGIPKLTAEYIPNMKPNRLWRNLPAAAYCGRSDYAGVEPMMDALDETMSSWMRDVRQGKGRIVVSESALDNLGKGQGSRWDPDREVYEGLNVLAKPGENMISNIQFAIRVQEHRDTAQHQLEQILRGGGYSVQTFGLSGDIAVTATEVAARERSSITTRGRKIGYWRPGLQSFVETLLMIDAAQFGSGVTPVRPEVEWPDYVGTSLSENAATATQLRAAEAASTETLVKLVHQDWDDPEIAAEVARIRAEQPMAGPETDLGGLGAEQPAEPAMNGQGDTTDLQDTGAYGGY
jgi:hypothetical protein